LTRAIQHRHICYFCFSVPPGMVFSYWVFPSPSANAGGTSFLLLLDLVLLSD
jgi:hypothetical protein